MEDMQTGGYKQMNISISLWPITCSSYTSAPYFVFSILFLFMFPFSPPFLLLPFFFLALLTYIPPLSPPSPFLLSLLTYDFISDSLLLYVSAPFLFFPSLCLVIDSLSFISLPHSSLHLSLFLFPTSLFLSLSTQLPSLFLFLPPLPLSFSLPLPSLSLLFPFSHYFAPQWEFW